MFSLAVLKDRDASKIFAGQAISQICDKMMSLGLVWVIASAGSLRLVPWFLAAGALPHLVLARFSGNWVERFGPLKAVITTDLIRGIIYVAAALVWSSESDLSLLFLVTILANCASALFNPAILSLPPRLKLAKNEYLSQLTAMIDSCFSLGNILGPVAAVALYPLLGLKGLFLLNSASYIFAGLLETRVRLAHSQASMTSSADAVPSHVASEQSTEPKKLGISEDRLIRYMLISFFLMNLVLTPLLAFLPLFAKTQFEGQIGVLAAMETAIGAGSVLGGVFLSVLKFHGKAGPKIIASLFVIALTQLTFSLSHDSKLTCLALFVLGIALSVINISVLTLFQTRPRETDVPKVMSYVNLISVGAIPLSMIVIGGCIELLPLRTFAVGLSLAYLAIASVTALNPEVRRV